MRTSGKLTIIATAIVVVAAGAVAGAQARKQAQPVKVASNSTSVRTPNPPAPETAEPAADLNQTSVTRETYSYPGLGRRDPFVSLMNTEEIRPLLADLKLVAVALDPLGRNSVAVLRDISSKEQYRVKVGQEIGRMRVAAIREKSVIFGIEEFGYSRQETLAMTADSTKARTQ
jgi:hypothetical protein